MANTSIRIKRSLTVDKPTSLESGELGYSYLSNTIFIGSPTGNGVVNVGGQFYTSQIDNATNLATPSTLVERDDTGNVSFNYVTANVIGTIVGNANSATRLETPRNFSVSGTDITAPTVSFDGKQNVILNAALNEVPGLTAGEYGSTTQIPVVTVGANGRVLAISTSTISTDLNIAGDTGTDAVALLSDTLSFLGGTGITSSVTNSTVTFDVDTTVVRSNTAISKQTIDGDVEIAGNLVVFGTETKINTQSLNVSDPVIYLASNNSTSDVLDSGFVSQYNDGTLRHSGLIRNAGDKEYYIFDNYDKPLSSNNEIDVADASFRAANVHAGYVKSLGVISSSIKSTGTEDLVLNSNGFSTTFKNNGQILPSGALIGGNFSGNQIDVTTVGFGTQIKGLYEGVDIRVSSDGSGANVSSFNTNGTLTVAGKVTAGGLNLNDHASGAFDKANSAVFNAGSDLTTGAILIGASGNTLTTLANTTYLPIGSGAGNNTISSVVVDAYGRLVSTTFTAISGLTVGQGGTGRSSFTSNGITFGNGTGALNVTAAAGTSDQTWSNQILTTTDAGVPVWSTSLDGGSF